MEPPGVVEGKHYSAHAEEVRRLKRAGDLEGAERLLMRLIAATEDEARANGWGVAPWYYDQIAIVYRRLRNRAKEIAVLERYERQAKAPGAGAPKLAARLAKLRSSAASSQDPHDGRT